MGTQVTITGPNTKPATPHVWKAGDWFAPALASGVRMIVQANGRFVAVNPEFSLGTYECDSVEGLMQCYPSARPLSRVQIRVTE